MEGVLFVLQSQYPKGGINVRYKEVDYGGEKLMVKVFDYHTPEG